MQNFTVKLGDRHLVQDVYYKKEEVQGNLSVDFLAENDLYTILFVDHEAPKGIYLHFCKINVSNKDGEVIAETVPPSPPREETHRYSVLVYKQNNKMSLSGAGPQPGADAPPAA